jgi:hypothetical protein
MNTRPGGVPAAATVAVTVAAGALAVLAGAGTASAGADADPTPTTSPSPPADPRPASQWLITLPVGGGVKMFPLPGPGLAGNAEPAHRVGEWYTAAVSVNPFAAANFVRRDGVGTAVVWFPGLAPSGPVEVTSPTGVRCAAVRVVLAPAAYPGTDVTVSCVTGTGSAADSTFTVRL